jgi:maltose alpha-D-glucosyltransferase/alpha-amylase
VAENDVIIDFEGEPAWPLGERRAKHSPLPEVAGMLRSFDYAVHGALGGACADRPEGCPYLEPLMREWERRAAMVFPAGYREKATGTAVYPVAGEQSEARLRLFGLEKALYEARYELDNRPDRVAIPLRGLIAEQPESGPDVGRQKA